MLLKCPVSYSLVRYLSCFNPCKMVSDKDGCIKMFKKVLNLFLNVKRIEERKCDVVLQQYTQFIDNIPVFGTERFSKFNKNQDSIDELYYECMCGGSGEQYTELFEVVKIVLVLSHGQAAVERGFSVNKEIEVENMKQQTLVAHRVICDHVTNVEGILNVDLNKDLLLSARMSRQRYDAFLEQERQNRTSQLEQKKRKCLLEEMEEIKKKKRRTDLDIESLNTAADKLYEQAEASGKICFVTQANSLRRTAKDKLAEKEKLDENLNNKLEE